MRDLLRIEITMIDLKPIPYTQIPLFEGISAENLNELLHCLHNFVREYKKGEVIIIEEENIQNIGIVLFGTVHMVKYDYWGKQTMLAYMGEGELFGEVFAVQKMNNSHVSFVAASDCQVLFLRAANIIHTCQRSCPFHHKLSENMFNLIGQKSVKLMERIEVASKPTLREKILSYLSMQAQKSVGSKFEIPLNRTSLADFLDSNRSAMTRELFAMKAEGIIDFEKNVFTLK